jgi:hypothetical protein
VTPWDRRLLLALAAALLLMLALALHPGTDVGPTGEGITGRPRNVEVDLLRRRILAGELSDKEAMYYR